MADAAEEPVAQLHHAVTGHPVSKCRCVKIELNEHRYSATDVVQSGQSRL